MLALVVLVSVTSAATEYRGVNTYLELLDERSVRVLAEDWNVNLIRVCMGMLYRGGAFTFEDGPDVVLEDADLALLDKCLDTCEEFGVQVILSLHQFLGNIVLPESGDKDTRLWTDFHFHDLLVSFWRKLAAHCSERGDVIYGYNLLNEPRPERQVAGMPSDWNALAQRITDVIREVDSAPKIIIEATADAGPKGFLELKPTSDDNTAYAFHTYWPYEFTGQWMFPHTQASQTWPAPAKGWNVDGLREELKPVLDFQQRYGVEIIAAEFGACVWADEPSRSAFIRDCATLFEELGFDYCFWAFREFPVFSLEHETYFAEWGRYTTFVPETQSLEAFRQFFALNKLPQPVPAEAIPACIFDESHWQEDDDAKAMSGDLGWRLRGLCEVKAFTSGEISSALVEADLLVTGAWQIPMSNAEEQAVEDFVRQGGALLFYGDPSGLAAESLLRRFGLGFNPRPVKAIVPTGGDPGSFWIEGSERDHEITQVEWSFHTNWAGSVTAIAPAILVASTPEATWCDFDGDYRRDTPEEVGPFGVLAVSEFGEGRVAVLADNAFGLPWNWPLISRTVEWLLTANEQDRSSQAQPDDWLLDGEIEEILMVDDFEDGDLYSLLGATWEGLSATIAIGRDIGGAYLEVELPAASYSAVHVPMARRDVSDMDGIFIVWSASDSLSVDLKLNCTISESAEEFINAQYETGISGAGVTERLLVPFSEFRIRDSGDSVLPYLEWFFNLAILTDRGPGTIHIHEVGFYKRLLGEEPADGAVDPTDSASITMSIDTTAIPLLLRIDFLGGEGPFTLDVVGTDARDKHYEIKSSTVEQSVSVAIPWNRRHIIQVSAEDSRGQSVTEAVECEHRIRQNEPFTLDATRYGDPLHEGSWVQAADVGNEQLHSESNAAITQVSHDRAEAVAPWPGLYILQIGHSEDNVEVTVAPAVDFQLEIRGMCEDYEPRALGFTHLEEHLSRMAADGINAVQFVRKLTMTDLKDSVVHDPCPYPDWDEKLACAIRAAKSAGFTVMLRICLWLDAAWPESDATMQALEPDDWAAWFRSYGEFALRYADLAEAADVDVYQFADNLHTTYGHENDYRSLITLIRSRFSGSLLVSTGPWFRNGLDRVGFWDALDYIGICGSFHTGGDYSTAIEMKTDDVYEVYRSIFEREILPTANRFQKQVLCCEAYYQSRAGSTYSPSGIPNWGSPGADYSFTQPVSFAEQARGYDAYLRVVSQYTDVFAGMFALQWCLEDPTWPVLWGGGGTHNIYSTPAEGLFSIWWDGLVTPEGVPTATSDCSLAEEVGGYWTMWTFGGATGAASLNGRQVQELVEGSGMLDVGPNSPLDVSYSNPGRMLESVCTLLLNFGALRDLSNYAGILLDASAIPAAMFQIELDYGEEWIPCLSQLVEIGPQRELHYIAFDDLSVAEHARTQYSLGEKEIDFSQVRGIRVNLLSRGGMLHIYQFSPATGCR